jgi:hypothetical protein
MNSYIYVIGTDKKPYKIGFSNKPARRLKDLQTGHPEQLTIHYLECIPKDQVKFIEKSIHSVLRHRRAKGEWFDLELEEAIAEVKFARIRYLQD